MCDHDFLKASFDLGRLSSVAFAINSEVLRVMAESVAKVVPADIVGIAVYRNGIGDHATHCHVIGTHAAGNDCSNCIEDSSRSFDDRELARALNTRQRGRVFRRSDLLGDEPSLALSTTRRSGMGDQALCLFTRSDGAELIIGVNNMESTGAMSDASIAEFQKIAPFAAVAWAARWRNEPAWIGQLKPQGRRILELVLTGYDDEQIAQRTGLTYHSVRAHLKRLFREADVRSRLHLMQVCRDSGAAYHSLVMNVSVRQPADRVACVG